MNTEERAKKLEELAAQDLSYQTWKQSYEDSAEAFKAFADAQPEDIRNMLYCYAESGRLMNQRLAALACEEIEE